MSQAISPTEGKMSVLARLETLCQAQGLGGRADVLARIQALVGRDLRAIEGVLEDTARGRSLAERAAAHLLDRPGKRVRPIVLLLAARLGPHRHARARDLAVAVELVHSATLLHDDVVDAGTLRRGAPASRVVYGNAASVFAGDWLLVDALRRVRSARVPDALEHLLEVLFEMIDAESVQLERRGRLELDEAAYFKIVDGKTAALFMWAAHCGGRASGLSNPDCERLGEYGRGLGRAFQLVDDVLDVDSHPTAPGQAGMGLDKTVFADVREGKMTYPLIIAAQREPATVRLLEDATAASTDAVPPAIVSALQDVLHSTGAVAATRERAAEEAERAIQALDGLADNPARDALNAIVGAVVRRKE